MGGAYGTYGGKRFGWGKSEGTRPFWRHGRRWQDNVKMDLKKEIRRDVVN